MSFTGKFSEILIVGGGVIGLTLARELHKRNFGKITILERGEIGRESSYAAAGMLAPQAETNFPDEFFRFCSESNKLYPAFAEELSEETGIDVEFDRNGTLYTAFSEADVREIRRRFEWQKKAGLQIEHLTAGEVRKIEPFVSPDVLEGLLFPEDWQIENRKLLYALRKYAELNEIKIIERTEIKSLIVEKNRIVGAESESKKFFAGKVILATGAWTSLIKAGGFVLPEIKPIRGQIIAFHTAKRLFQKVIYSPRGYIVPRFDGRILAGATVEDSGFDKSVTPEGAQFLLENALEIAPCLANLKITEKWAGLRPFASDGLPVLGEIPALDNLFVAAAHYRNGILLAPLTAKILADRIVSNLDSNFLEIFSPRRFRAARAR